jgi:hypothetical protein
MQRVLDFIRYNNALPIALFVLFLGAGGALAASPDLRGDVYTAQSDTVSVDNSYIVNANLDAYTPGIQITNVTEDGDNYYVAYTLQTIDLSDGVWQSVSMPKTLTVAKGALGSRDLGIYVTGQLSEVSGTELTRLRETQTFEKNKGITQKVVATTYSGLIGKFIDPKEETLPGYTPVIPDASAQTSSGGSASETPASTDSSSGDSTPPSLTVLGNNPARIALHASYSDLGAVVQDNVDHNLGYRIKQDGIEVPYVTIDTSAAGEYSVTYTAKDQAGNEASATRTIIVYDPFAPVSDIASTTASTTQQEAPQASAISDTATSSNASSTSVQ